MDEPWPTGRYEVGRWERSWDDDAYGAAVESVREAIAAGDVYQVNLVQHLSAPFRGDAAGLARALAPLRPLEPRTLAGQGWAVVSASPEQFLDFPCHSYTDTREGPWRLHRPGLRGCNRARVRRV